MNSNFLGKLLLGLGLFSFVIAIFVGVFYVLWWALSVLAMFFGLPEVSWQVALAAQILLIIVGNSVPVLRS